MPGFSATLCIQIQLVFQQNRRVLTGHEIIIAVINAPQRAGAGKNQRVGISGGHQLLQRVFVVQVNIPHHAVLHIILEKIGDFRIAGQKVGAF
ncbi:Uncharacterised protein [Escherichia coli]|nr:Uncharacterised protein [Escherichia coli]